ncbi:MAG: hypothetical protein O2971_05725 [Proteobacteria bacterium]|nr:hypothetical protein [Pseudomonadota bacterium]
MQGIGRESCNGEAAVEADSIAGRDGAKGEVQSYAAVRVVVGIFEEIAAEKGRDGSRGAMHWGGSLYDWMNCSSYKMGDLAR